MSTDSARGQVYRGSRWGAVALGALAVLLVGCAILAEPTPTPEPVKIMLVFPADLEDHYNELIKEFNAQHPYITVERRVVRTPEKLESLFREKEADVFFFTTDGALFQDLYDEDRVLSLTPFLQESDAIDLNDFYPDTLSPVSLEGSVWGIPSAVNMAVMYYNKDLFDQNNAPYPEAEWTWDDFVMAGSAVTDPDQDVYGFVSFPTFAIPFIYQHGGRIFDDVEMPTRTTFDDPLTIEAVEWYASLVHDYGIMPTPEEATKTFANDGAAPYIFWRKKAGMYVGMLSDRGGLSWGPGARWQMEWGIVPLPRDESAFTFGFIYGHAVSADTSHPEACYELLVFLNERMMPYMMPARRSVTESAAFEQQVGAEAASVARASIESMVVVSDIPDNLEQGLEGFVETLIAILNGEVPAEQGMVELQRQAESR
jgi:multiple sugar transport system substrate-binding protein